ncbi:hypothetical protein OG280_40025 [Streptomyces virginiae]|uniref:hypothetical protein n=1 Tax=Streptomyces virginiae TaxID=1961 RepID=UPI0032542A46
MTLLTQSTTLARPSHRLVEIYDSDAYRTDSTAVAAAERNVVGSNGYHLYLFSLQSDLEVEATVRVWDEPQPSPGEAEGFTEVSLEPETGILVIGQFAFGPAAEMSLPRPGVYEGHVSWTGRIAAAEYYEQGFPSAVLPRWGYRIVDTCATSRQPVQRLTGVLDHGDRGTQRQRHRSPGRRRQLRASLQRSTHDGRDHITSWTASNGSAFR